MRVPTETKRLIATASQIDLARLAAYLDGEGCISISGKGDKKWLYLQVSLDNTDPRLMQWCLRTFGGRMYAQGPMGSKRDMYKWVVNGADATLTLRACLPYFIMKRDQAEIALAFQSTVGKGGKALPQEAMDSRLILQSQLRKIKWASIDPDTGLPKEDKSETVN